MIKVLNCVIFYDNMEEICSYISSIHELNNSSLIAVAVTVNKHSKESIKEIKDKITPLHDHVLVVDSKINLGYMKGMVLGYETFKKEYPNEDIKYVMMSNTDIVYPNKDFVDRLLSNDYPKDTWSIGPAVYAPKRKNYDNPIADTRRDIKEVKKLINIFSNKCIGPLYIRLSGLKGKLIKNKIGNSREVYEVHGCFFIVSKECADYMIDHPFRALLYSEESYVAETVFQNHKIAYYDKDLLVHHLEHTVTGKLNYKKIAFYIADSMQVILEDYYL